MKASKFLGFLFLWKFLILLVRTYWKEMVDFYSEGLLYQNITRAFPFLMDHTVCTGELETVSIFWSRLKIELIVCNEKHQTHFVMWSKNNANRFNFQFQQCIHSSEKLLRIFLTKWDKNLECFVGISVNYRLSKSDRQKNACINNFLVKRLCS